MTNEALGIWSGWKTKGRKEVCVSGGGQMKERDRGGGGPRWTHRAQPTKTRGCVNARGSPRGPTETPDKTVNVRVWRAGCLCEWHLGHA